ncbi:MAG TPA: thioredoxin family protein [Gemmatimonadaceae bacterium]
MLAINTLRARYEGAASFEQFVAGAAANVELWHALARRAETPDSVVRDIESVGGAWHLLVLTEDWCGDAVNTLPVLAAISNRARNLDLRILSRDANPDLMDAHLTGRSRSIPIVIVLDSQYVERAWWGPRPAPLQGWVVNAGRALTPEERYREVRRWYARDRGASTLAELLATLRKAQAARAA